MNRTASMRSRMPPWPGSSEPESLTPTERLISDSVRSPSWPRMPPGIASSATSSQVSQCAEISLSTATPTSEPAPGAGPGLLGADGLVEPGLAEVPAGEVAAGVGDPGDDQHDQHGVAAVGGGG